MSAVLDYAARMRADARAYLGYYGWQVICALRNRLVLLPVGFPAISPTRLTVHP